MRKTLVALFIPLLVAAASAQTRTGNIFGKVLDPKGNPLPGVSVTLVSPMQSPVTMTTAKTGAFRFLSLPPGADYSLRLERKSFKARVDTGIRVKVGVDVRLTMTMEPGDGKETASAPAEAGMIDRKTWSGTNVTSVDLETLPAARDPWDILQLVPSVTVQGVDVGGTGLGDRPIVTARGADPARVNNVWSVDGAMVSDPSETGAAPTFGDIGPVREMQISVGGSDVTVQTAGVAVNMVTGRGSNRIGVDGRLFFTGGFLQANKSAQSATIRAEENPGNAANLFRTFNRIDNNKDAGIDVSLPLLKNRAWLWASYGYQDYKTSTIYDTDNNTRQKHFAAKFNLQIVPSNRLEVFYAASDVERWGADASSENPTGVYRKSGSGLGNPILKVQDEQMFGRNMMVSLKYTYSDSGYEQAPMSDLDLNAVPFWDNATWSWTGSTAVGVRVERPVTQYSFMGEIFKDNGFLHGDHDIKFGAEYSERKQRIRSGTSGNMALYGNFQSSEALFDTDGDSIPDAAGGADTYYFLYRRGCTRNQRVRGLSAFLSDSAVFGRFNMTLGLRYDWQQPFSGAASLSAVTTGAAWDAVADPSVQTALDDILPSLDITDTYVYTYDLSAENALTATGDKLAWTILSPRLNIVWDLFGKGKSIARMSVARYGDYMGTDTADWADAAGANAWAGFYWRDADASGTMQLGELYWLTRRQSSGNYVPYNVFDGEGNFIGNTADAAGYYWDSPAAATVLSGTNTSRTDELVMSLEQELSPNSSLGLAFTYRKYNNYTWSRKYWDDGDGTITVPDSSSTYSVTQDEPEESYYRVDPGTGQIIYFVPDTGAAPENEYYAANTAYNVYSPYSLLSNRSDFYRVYYGLDLSFNKRLSNKWMLNGTLTWQKQAQHYGPDSYLNATNLWSYAGSGGTIEADGPLGRISQGAYSRWLLKVSGLYQLPYGIDLSGTLVMREGWIQDEYFTLVDNRLASTYTRSSDISMNYYGSRRLPAFYNLSFRLEKMFKVGDGMRLYVMLDVFNALNKMMVTSRYPRYLGTVNIYGDSEGEIDWSKTTFTRNPAYNAIFGLLNPRTARLGIRFQF